MEIKQSFFKKGARAMGEQRMISRKDIKERYRNRISKRGGKQGYQGWKPGKGFKKGGKKSREGRRCKVGKNAPIVFNTSSPTSSRPLTSKVRTWYW
jgi:hypothetical protein